MIELKVCVGSSCHLKGSYNLIHTFQQLIEENHLNEVIELKASFCLKQCQKGVAVSVKDRVFSVTRENVTEFFKTHVLDLAEKKK